jgi:hypothetical protein
MPFEAIEVSNSVRSFVDNLKTRREPILEDISNNRRVEGGFEEPHISTKPE